MKRISLLLLLLVLACGSVLADDEGNIYWRLDESPILIQNNVLIPVGSVLSIEAGTEVVFSGGVGIVIKGRIQTVNDGKVYLKGDSTSLWKGIELQTEEKFTVENLHISNASQAIKLVSSGNVTISNNVLEDNGTGIHIGSDDGNRGRINSILDNQIRNNGIGVNVDSTGANLERNIIVSNQSYGVNLTGGSCGGGSACGWTSSLSDNLISGSDIGVKIYGHHFELKGNDISSSRKAIVINNLKDTNYLFDQQNFASIDELIIENLSPLDVNLGQFWMGGEHEIKELIYDYRDDGSKGVVIISLSTDYFENYFTSSDTDSDGLPNYREFELGTNPIRIDTDSDGSNDMTDAFPLDALETVDTDSDGIGDNTDADDDNDGVLDALIWSSEIIVSSTDQQVNPSSIQFGMVGLVPFQTI